MPRYPYRDLGTSLGRDFRNNLNANFDDIEADLRDIQSDLDAKESRLTQIENDSIERDNDLDARIDNLVLSAGDSGPEVTDARYDSRTNTTFPTLKDRLDTHSNEIGILYKNVVYVDAQSGANDTEKINNAITKLKTLGGGILVFSPNKTYITTGGHIIPSNVWVKGGGASTIIQLESGTTNSVFTTDNTLSNTNIVISDLVVDGNYFGDDDPAIQKSYHALYLRRITGLTIFNVTVKNPVAWCANIDTCEDVIVYNYRAFSNGAQMDGLHFMDCKKVRVDNVYGETGDDVLGITVTSAGTEIYDYVINNVQGKSIIGSLVRLNQSDASVAAGESKTIRNMQFRNLNGWDCGNRGFSLVDVHSSSIVRDITIEGNFRNCSREGIYIIKGDKVNVKAILRDTGTGAGLGDGSKYNAFRAGTLNNSKIDLQIINVADGYNGILIENGDNNDVKFDIDYINTGKSNLQMCVRLENCNYNRITGITNGGQRGIQIGATGKTATYNKIDGCIIKNTTGYGIAEGGSSDNNEIKNNTLISTSGINKVGASTKIRNNTGYITEARGTATITSGSTSITVNHGLNGVPSVVIATGQHSEVKDCYITNITSTYFTINVPSAVTANRTISWIAEI
jgi:hypothetical protein